MKKGIIFLLALLFTVSFAFAAKSAPIQYDPANYPAPTRQGGDTVGSATVIASLPYNDIGTTAGYVDDYDEECPYTGSTAPDVVYAFTPASDVDVVISLCGDTDYDTKLYVYENTVTPGTPFACNDDECTSALGQDYVSELSGLSFTSGNTYYIVVDGYGGLSGNYEIDVAQYVAGDTCDDAIVVGEVTDLPFDTTIATASGFGTYITSQDLFYVYTAPSDGALYVGLCDSGFDTKLALYGDCDPVSEIATNDDSCGLQSELIDIPVTAGDDYYIQVGGYSSSSGTGLLDVAFTSSFVPEPPTNLMVTEDGYATWEEPASGTPDALYEQLEFVSTEGGISSQDFEAAYDQYDAEGADEFMIPAGEEWTIEEVVILGSYSAAGPCDLANIRFFDDNAGMPGTLLFEYLDVPANPDVDGNLDCTIDPTVLTEGTYWLSVQGRQDFATGGQWYWTRQAAPTIGYEFHWQNPLDGFSSGFTTWVAGSVNWPGQNDYNLSFGLYGSAAVTEAGKTTVHTYEYDAVRNVRNTPVESIDPLILAKGPKLTGNRNFNTNTTRDFIAYNVYLDGALAGSTTDLFYQYTGLVDGTEYLAEVTADYDEGESVPIDYTFTYVEQTTNYIEIGDGQTYGAYPVYYGDFANYWENCHTQTLYLASELGEATTLTELSWELERIAAAPDNWLSNVVISILPTADAELTEGDFYDMTGATVVWSNANYVPAVDVGWNDPIDITDYDYNGTDNLIVDILWGDNGYYESPYYRHMRTDGGVTRVLLGYADGETPPLYDNSSTEFANIRFYFESGTTEAPDVFFSEYIEGSSNNKAIEIYNNTGDVIELDNYRINQSVNGGGWEYQHIFPAGATLADGDVWVILNDATDPGLFDIGDADEVLGYPSVVHHNGDDARGLEYTDDGGATWTLIDVIGNPDEDPGSGWDVAGVTAATQNHTLVRKAEITTGNTDWIASAGTSVADSEWEVYEEDTFMYLGQHPGTGGTTFDPPTNVMVDDETGTITWLPPTVTVIEDNFDSYTPGDFIAEVGEDWTTWTGSPGSAEDAHVSDAQSYSPSNSILVEEGNDLILIMDDYTEGKVAVDLMMYVPTGYCGYYNLQQTSTPGQYWGFQIYFQTDGTVIGDAGEAGALNFTFNHDEWMSCKVIVDLDNDLATYYHDGVEMISWQWSLGTFGNPQVNQLGGVNIFGGANTGTTDVPMFYVDDVMVGEVPADLTGFKLYLDSSEVTTVGADVGEYTYEGLDEDQTYLAGISALYDPDESEVVEVEFTYNPDTSFDPPTNPAADVSDYNDVVLTWEAPSGAAEWLRWDSGENFDAIGLTAGGTFLVAAKWDPADLTEYDGAQITKLEFFPNEVVTEYIAYVWEGANAGTMLTSEVVTTYNAAEFTEVVFSSPATIDASQELWIGYEVTHAAGAYPAGCDAGPAIAGYGDLISQDGGVTWDPLSGFGLDYNWNLAAYIESADGEPVVLSNPQKPLAKPVSRVLNQSNPFSCIQTTNLRETRSLSGYKIYQDGVEIDEVMDPATLTYTVGSLDAGTYSFTITAVYTAPEGESVETDPVSAEIVLNPPSNVDAQSQPPNIIITWGPPARGVDSYNIYRNGELHAENVTGVMFIDVNVPTGTYTYNLTTVYDGGWESAFSPNEIVEHVTGDDILKPTVTELTGNYPNPFNPETTISFSLKEAGHVTINIYNLRGQLVKTLVNTELDNAYYEYVWDGKDNSGKSTSSGVYFYKMKAKNYNSTKKMILMK